MRFRPLVVAFALAPTLAAQEPRGRAITHEDLWLLKRVGAPAVSPDGRWAVFAVTEPAYDPREQTSDLWLVSTSGNDEPRRLTTTRGGESGAAWSSDSRRIAFAATREGDDVPQLYVLDVLQGGESRRVTQAATGARAPRWSPDGTKLLYTSMVWPGATDDESNRRAAAEHRTVKSRARVYDAFPVRNWDRWRDDSRPHLWVQPLASGARPRDLLAGTRLAAAPGFSGTMGSGSEDLPATWAPDGRSVVFAASTEWDRSTRADVRQRLWRVSLGGGEPVAHTGDEGSYGAPQFTRDGRRLVVGFEPSNAHTYNDPRLVSFAWPAMSGRVDLSSALDRPAAEFGLSANGTIAWFLAESGGRSSLYSVPVTGGRPVLALEMTEGTLAGLGVGGEGSPVVVATRESATHPPEVVRLEPGRRGIVQLSHFTDPIVATLDLPSLRELTFTDAKGKRIQSFVALPPGFDSTRKYPLFVLIHGGPHGAWKDQWVLRWNYHLLAAPGYVVLLTNYTGSPGFGEAFAQGVQGDPLAGPSDEINAAADDAIRRLPFVDGTRQVAGGASYGGHLAYWLEATTDRYKALIAHAGAVDPEHQWGTSDGIWSREVNFGGPVWERGPTWVQQSAKLRAPSFRTPLLVTVGEQDFRVPVNNSLEAFALLQRMQVPSRLVVFPDENHWVLSGENSRLFYGQVRDWLAKWLAAAPAAGRAAER